MRTLNVLSIDMDFFQDADITTLTECYPDGHDFVSPMLSAFIWSRHYSNQYEADKLNEVKCPEELLSALKDILKNQDKSVPVLIAQSHLCIYDFICTEAAVRSCNSLDVTNIDMHHDMFTDNQDTVDCGNWLNAIRNLLPTKVKWISHPLSAQLMDDKSSEAGVEVVVNDFSSLEDKQFDIIFLCRSDIWYAPHLDSKFSELVDLLQDLFEDVTIFSQGLIDRSTIIQPSENTVELLSAD